jgi:hypothetical protein
MRVTIIGEIEATLAVTDVSEEHIASIVREKTTGELGTKLAVTSDRSMLQEPTFRRNITPPSSE